MEDVRSVEYRALRETDTKALAKYTQLVELTLRGAPGRLTDASGLAALKGLRELTIAELYELDAKRWPTSWRFDGLTIRGLNKADAAALAKSQEGAGALAIRGAKSDAWIAENLGNPFRHWEDDEPAFGRAAMAAWKKANAAARKLGAKAAKPKAKVVLDDLVKALNRVDAKHAIDTLRRDEAADAYFALARGMAVAAADAERWLDDLREW
ncbi:MAG: hypothetical protein KIT84_19150 [Labilithrix sp.]|nr:hypothetical protein [Labilithrix sp.]MCW5813153.1 hypothetical protein [Labilithrix sp.]